MDNDLDFLINKALFYLKFRPRTEKELTDYLNKKIVKNNLSKDTIDKAIKILKDQGLIDDKKFINWFVDQRSSFRPRGVFALKTELTRYGIEEKLINDFFEKQTIDEEPLINRCLDKYLPRIKNENDEKKREKAIRYLLRRGFSFALINSVLAKRLKKD